MSIQKQIDKIKAAASMHPAWVLAIVIGVATTTAWMCGYWSNRKDRTPMLLTIQQGRNVVAEIECYVGHDGDPVWHGRAVGYNEGKRLAHALFRDGAFVRGDWDVGAESRAATPRSRFDMKKIISCRELSNTVSSMRPGKMP